MHKRVLLTLILTMLVSGCQSASYALDEAATMIAGTVTARPATATPIPTSMSLLAGTPTHLPTAQPIIALTSTVEAAKIMSNLDVQIGENSGIPYTEGYLAWKQSDPVNIELSGPQLDAIAEPIAEGVTAENFILRSKVTWKASGLLACGLAFRAETDLEQGKQYRFFFYRFSGLPAYEIDVFEFGQLRSSISGLKYFDELDFNHNEFVLIAQNEKFTIFINGEQQGEFYDWDVEREGGNLAFLATQSSGEGGCKFEDSWLWILPVTQ